MANRSSIIVRTEEVRKLFRRMVKLVGPEQRREILEQAAQPIIDQAKANIVDSGETHHQYNTGKIVKSIRTPKGQGQIQATYNSGNLRNSISIVRRGRRRKKSSAVLIGPKLVKKASGTYGKGKKTAGYYAHLVEYGSVNNPSPKSKGFMRRATQSQRGAAIEIVRRGIASVLIRGTAKL